MENRANAASRGHSRRSGGCGRAQSKVREASAAATNDRPAVTNSGIEVRNRQARRRQRQAEDHDADEPEQQGLAVARGGALGRRGLMAGSRDGWRRG